MKYIESIGKNSVDISQRSGGLIIKVDLLGRVF